MKEIFKKEGIIFLQPENYEDAVDEGKRMRNAVHYFYEHRAQEAFGTGRGSWMEA